MTLNYARSSALVSDDTPPAEMMQTSIGQGKTQITPMHLNMITCAIANNGVLMKPYAIDHVENDEGTVIKSFKPSEYGSLMSEEESAILRQLMTDVVQEGTASKLKGLEYTAAGKQVPRNIIILKVTVMHGLPDLLLQKIRKCV